MFSGEASLRLIVQGALEANRAGVIPAHQPVIAAGCWGVGCESQAPPGLEAPIAQGVGY